MVFFDKLLCCCQPHSHESAIAKKEKKLETEGDCCGFLFNTTNLYVIVGIVGAILGTVSLCAALSVPGLASVSGFLFTAGTAVGATPLTLSAFVTSVGGACIITAVIGLSIIPLIKNKDTK